MTYGFCYCCYNSDKLTGIVGKMRGNKLNIEWFTEFVLLDKLAIDRYNTSDLLVVGPCIENDNYYPSDYDDTNEKAKKKEYDD